MHGIGALQLTCWRSVVLGVIKVNLDFLSAHHASNVWLLRETPFLVLELYVAVHFVTDNIYVLVDPRRVPTAEEVAYHLGKLADFL